MSATAQKVRTKTLFLIFSHTLTDEQKEAARESGITEFRAMPDELLVRWKNVPPELESLRDHLAPILSWLRENAKHEDYVLVSGDLGATFYIARKCIADQIAVPIYATTQRITEEVPEEDGSIRKVSVFRHVRFRGFGD